ncbi:MAG: hypothetical protein J1E80_03530 [Desulfovibrionaceae bacterium]|nr:hypothetical protein [Desulfovibrionaceae bacterium]
MEEALVEMYRAGVSVRRVEELRRLFGGVGSAPAPSAD